MCPLSSHPAACQGAVASNQARQPWYVCLRRADERRCQNICVSSVSPSCGLVSNPASWSGSFSAAFGSGGMRAPVASSVGNVLPQLCSGKSLAAALFPTGHGKSLRADSLFANLNPCVHAEGGLLSCCIHLHCRRLSLLLC